MKFFNIFLTSVFVALLAAVGSFAQTSDQVITAVDSFIIVIRTLDTQVPSLNVINFPTMGFIIADGLNNITQLVNTSNADFLPDTPPYPDDAAVMVADVVATFAAVLEQVLQVLLNAVIEKEPLAAMFNFLAPIAAALRGLELSIQTFAFDLIDLIPTQADTVLLLFDEVRGNITLAISAYGP